jgi:4-hydroxythreonine-4-phosphate dehydrogenase
VRPLAVIAVTSGEPAGIGPELCLRLIEHSFAARIVVLADRTLMAARAAALGFGGILREWDPALPSVPGTLDVLHLPLAAQSLAGQLDPANAAYVLRLLGKLCCHGHRAGA